MHQVPPVFTKWCLAASEIPASSAYELEKGCALPRPDSLAEEQKFCLPAL